MDLESDNERSRSLKPHQEDTPWNGSSNDSNLHLDSENNTSESSSSDYSSKNSKTTIHAFNLFSPDESFRALPSSTSSSLAMPSDGLSQVLPTAPTKSHMNVYCSDKLENQSEASSTDYVSGDSSVKSDELEYKSMGSTSTSTVSDITHKSAVSTQSLIQPPPAQVMDRSGGTEPYGIPSSVFARSKSSTPVEWSLSSNDSLFSIQIGNNSFSREHVIMSGGNPPKPSELPLSTLESIPFRPQSQGEAVVATPDDDINELEIVFKANQRSVGFVQENNDRQIKEKTATDTVGPTDSSRHPDRSWTSAKTISCPMEKKSECQKPTHTSWMRKMFCRSKKSSCCISNCSWASCYCCKCPSCSCLSCGSCCTFCYSSNCCPKRIGCSHTVTEVDGSNPIEIDNQKYREQLQYQHQNVQKPSHTPASRSSSKGSCGSCGSCGSRGSCCYLRSCCSSWSCCSWRSCCSWWSCCSLQSCCSWWSCCSLQSCSSGCSCSLSRACFSCRSCLSCFSCNSCHSCCSCCCCCSSFSCHLRCCC